MIGGPNLRYVQVDPQLAQCTSTTAANQFTILLSSGVPVQSSFRYSGTLLYIISPYLLLRLMVPRRIQSNLPVSHPTPGIQIVD